MPDGSGASTWADWAGDSIRRGFECVDGGGDGLRWFERAWRLAPHDPLAAYSYASALCAAEPGQALRLLDQLLQRCPSHRAASVSRIAVLSRLGCHADAARALDTFLSCFAPPRTPAFRTLADRVCSAAGVVGWVGLTADGLLLRSSQAVITSRSGGRKVTRLADAVPTCVLPAGWRRWYCVTSEAASGRVAGARIRPAHIARIRGRVALSGDRTLTGHAHAPADPDAMPVIELTRSGSRAAWLWARAERRIAVTTGDGSTLLSREVVLTLPKDTDFDEIHVRAADGEALDGSPVRVFAEAKAAREAALRAGESWRPLPVALASLTSPPRPEAPPRAALDIVVFAPDASDGASIDCWDALLGQLPAAARVTLVLGGRGQGGRRLAGRAASSGVRIVTDRAGAWSGLSGRDVLVLNGRTRLPPDAVRRLAMHAYAEGMVGAVVPMNTDGWLTSRLGPDTGEAMLSADRLHDLDQALQGQGSAAPVDLPTCGGSCVYIRHDCWSALGPPRDAMLGDLHAQLLDFGLRLRHGGWLVRVARDILVSGEAAATPAFEARSLSDAGPTLERLHPGMAACLAAWRDTDPLRPTRFHLDAALWARGRLGHAALIVTHDAGGGVERFVAQRVAHARARGLRPIVVRPGDRFVLSDGVDSTHRNLVFETVEALAEFVRPDHPVAVELHHIAAFDPAIVRLSGLLRVAFDVYVHDFAAICPRVTLCGRSGTYCGEPDDAFTCPDCIADNAPRVPLAEGYAAYIERNATVLRLARRVIAPSADAASRISRFLPGVTPVVEPWEDDASLSSAVALRRAPPGRRLRVGLVGAIGDDKGYHVLLGCARDAARRKLDLDFTVVGHTIDDARLMATERVFVTGPFAEGEAPGLLGRAECHIGFLPSVWPETWCFALSSLWLANLYTVAFDIGAPAERIGRTGAGALLPLHARPSYINDFFMAAAADGRAPGPGAHPRARLLMEAHD